MQNARHVPALSHSIPIASAARWQQISPINLIKLLVELTAGQCGRGHGQGRQICLPRVLLVPIHYLRASGRFSRHKDFAASKTRGGAKNASSADTLTGQLPTSGRCPLRPLSIWSGGLFYGQRSFCEHSLARLRAIRLSYFSIMSDSFSLMIIIYTVKEFDLIWPYAFSKV